MINEVLTKRMEAPPRDSGDWAEIYNATAAPVDIAGYYLSDDRRRPQRWRFPKGHPELTVMPPQGHLVVWLDGRPEAGPLHAPFKLSSRGEELVLSSPDSDAPLDAIRFGSLPPDVSYGRQPDGSTSWRYFTASTPGEPNGDQGKIGIAPAPTADPIPGNYTGPISIRLASSLGDAALRYTLDGSAPSLNSSTYKGPIQLSSTAVLRAISISPEYVPSKPLTATFLIQEPSILPIVSITADPRDLWDDSTGIYTKGLHDNYLKDWERPAWIEFFEPDGRLAFRLEAGLKVSGGTTRKYPQKSLNIIARKKYGKRRIEYPLFPDLGIQVFKSFRLRMSGHDSESSFLRDALMQRLVRDTHIDTQGYRPVVVFLNGEYWGLYNMREKHSRQYFVSHHGIDPRRGDVIEPDLDHPNASEYPRDFYRTVQGDAEDYLRLLELLRDRGNHSAERYSQVTAQVDLENFTDYYIAQIYFANADWLDNNTRIWRSGEGGKWRWLLFDTDLGFGFGPRWGIPGGLEHNTLEWSTHCCSEPTQHDLPGATDLIEFLLENQEYQQYFVERFASHLSYTFCPAKVTTLIDELAREIEPEMPRQIERWRMIPSLELWRDHVEELRIFARRRPAIVFQHLAKKFKLPPLVELRLRKEPSHGGALVVAGVRVPHDTEECVGLFPQGVPVEIQAVPGDGFRFADWRGDFQGRGSRARIVPEGDLQLVARFEADR